MKAILEYRNHPDIATIKDQCENRASFRFPKLDKKEDQQGQAHFNQFLSKTV